MNNKGNFYSDLAKYTKENDTRSANSVVMRELGICLAKDKSNFIEVLRNANIIVPDNATDIQLINAFVDNAPSNRKLLLGASFLINHKNRVVGFDGTGRVSDTGVKATYKVMYSFFDAEKHEDTSDVVNEDYYDASGEENYSNAGWGDAVGAIANLGTTIGGGVIQGQRAKKFGASDTLAKQQEARRQMVQTVMAQRQAEAEAKQKEKERSAKTTKTLLIVGGAIVGLTIIGFVVYAIKKRGK